MHQISKKEQLEYYKQRVKEFNKNFSLPKLFQKEKSISNQEIPHKLPIKGIKRTISVNNYNKWYINPAQRFKNKNTQIEKEKNATKYV